MTDRVDSLTVVFEKDVRIDDCEEWINAIRMFRNVLSVKPHISGVGDHMAEERAKDELGKKLWAILHPER